MKMELLFASEIPELDEERQSQQIDDFVLKSWCDCDQSGQGG